jgi:hypothetical protein
MTANASARTTLALLLSSLFAALDPPRPAAAVVSRTETAATTTTLLDPVSVALDPALGVGVETGRVVDDVAAAPVREVGRLTLPSLNAALVRSVVSSGPGWARERFEGIVGPIRFTDDADYFVVADLEGIEAVPLQQVVGAEFAAFVRGAMRASALATERPEERIYVLQKSALQAIEPLWLDRDAIVQDPYAHLDRTICVPVPFVGGIAEPVFSPEVVIREIAPGVLEYHEALETGAAAGLGDLLGTVNLGAVRTSDTLSLALDRTAAAPTGAVAQSASAGGMTCFNLRDVLTGGDGGSCSVDLLDPSTWYRERDHEGTVDLSPPDVRFEATLDTADGLDALLLGDYYGGTLRYESNYRFENDAGRGIGGSLEVRAGELFCVPIWLRPVEGGLWAHVEASREFEMHGTLAVPTTQTGQVTVGTDGNLTLGRLPTGDFDARTGAQETELFSDSLPDPYSFAEVNWPEPGLLYPIPFSIGPVPILLIIDAPIELGLVGGVQSPTFTNFEAEGGLSMGFEYRCRFGGGCDAVEPLRAQAWGTAGVSGDVGAEGRAFVKPYVGLSLRASLYFPGAIFAKVGPRAYLNFDLWGASKRCGDADGDGGEEWIQALALDYDAGLELVYEVGIYDGFTGNATADWLLGFVGSSGSIGDPLDWHLGFANLKSPDGKGFQPMLGLPPAVYEDRSTTVGARMRPCYPYSDDVEYALSFGDGTSAAVGGDPQESAAAAHLWSNTGTYPVKLTAVRDSHGRVFDMAFGTPLVTSVTRALLVEPAKAGGKRGAKVKLRRPGRRGGAGQGR